MEHPAVGQVIIEGLMIGLIFLVIFIVLHVILMYVNSKFSMSHWGIFLCVFATAFLGHVGFEYIGLNDKFINHRSSLNYFNF